MMGSMHTANSAINTSTAITAFEILQNNISRLKKDGCESTPYVGLGTLIATVFLFVLVFVVEKIFEKIFEKQERAERKKQ